jgi:glutamate racemase
VLHLIAGRRTVVSGAYRRAFAQRGICLTQRIAQPLSAMIEAGDLGSPTFTTTCKQILRPLRDCSHILLACTHYPAASHALQQFVSSRTILIDPAAPIAAVLDAWPPSDKKPGPDEFLTTGDPAAMRRAAASVFGVATGRVRHVPGLTTRLLISGGSGSS